MVAKNDLVKNDLINKTATVKLLIELVCEQGYPIRSCCFLYIYISLKSVPAKMAQKP